MTTHKRTAGPPANGPAVQPPPPHLSPPAGENAASHSPMRGSGNGGGGTPGLRGKAFREAVEKERARQAYEHRNRRGKRPAKPITGIRVRPQ